MNMYGLWPKKCSYILERAQVLLSYLNYYTLLCGGKMVKRLGFQSILTLGSSSHTFPF